MPQMPLARRYWSCRNCEWFNHKSYAKDSLKNRVKLALKLSSTVHSYYCPFPLPPALTLFTILIISVISIATIIDLFDNVPHFYNIFCVSKTLNHLL